MTEMKPGLYEALVKLQGSDESLRDGIYARNLHNGSFIHAAEVFRVLAEYLPDPPIEEPTGLGAVVRVTPKSYGDPIRATRTSTRIDDPAPWLLEGAETWKSWATLTLGRQVEILSPGVES